MKGVLIMPWWVILIIIAVVALPVKIKIMKKMFSKKKTDIEED